MYPGRKVGFFRLVAFLDSSSARKTYSPSARACSPSTRTATTRGQKAHLALGAHHIFCNTSIVLRVFFFFKRSLWAAGKQEFFLPAAAPERA